MMASAKFSLLPDWRGILRRAWSIRLMLLAGVLTACEAILPLYADAMPRGTFAIASGIVIVTALVARLLAQKGISQ